MNWNEKYRPQEFKEIFLSDDNKKIINSWIKDFNNKTKKYKNCLFLLGPPGVGKTSVAQIILKKYNYDIIEFNSSDIRNQKTLKDLIDKINGNISVIDFMCNRKKKIAIIIDEIDGLGNAEKGSLTELISIVTDSRKKNIGSPFIFISNTMNKKLTNFKNKCVFVKIYKPNGYMLKNLILNISKKENFKVSNNIISLITKKSQFDFRKVINILEYIYRYNKEIKENDIISLMEDYDLKKIEYTLIDSVSKIFSSYNDEIGSLYDTDKNLVGCYLYENFPNYITKNTKNSEKDKINAVAKIYDNFSISDNVDHEIYINQNFNISEYTKYFKAYETSFIINNMQRYSFNKCNALNYSTLINKISLEFLNNKHISIINNLLNLSNCNSFILTYDIIFLYFFDNDKKNIQSLIKKYSIDKILLDKIIKYSTLYKNEKYTELIDNQKQFLKRLDFNDN